MPTFTASLALRVATMALGAGQRITLRPSAVLAGMITVACLVLTGVHDASWNPRYAAVSPAPRTHQVRPWSQIPVTATAYDDHTQRTASGTVPHPGTLAVSRDLLRLLPFGSHVTIRGWRYVVEDTMARRWRRRVDIWVPSRVIAIRWGRQHVVLGITNPQSVKDPDR